MFGEMVRDGAVDGRVYTSREVFAAEIERIFARCWNYVGHLSEIPQPGDYRRATVAGRPVILVRHEDGTPRVLLNRCAHRGAAVVGRDCGRARRLRCPWKVYLENLHDGLHPPHVHESSISAARAAAAKGEPREEGTQP